MAFEYFEKTPGGEVPHRLLDSHPDGKYLAMQAGVGPESLIWEKETRRIAWIPARAIALAWLRNGTQIAMLREASDSLYEFAIYTWPETQLLHSCPVSPPSGWGEMIDLVISPQNDLALCHWIDQSEAGFEFIDITPQSVSQASQSGYFLEGTNDVTRPAFSPDGHLWAFCYKVHEIWWATDLENPDPYQPARGGEYPLGALMVFDGKRQPPHSIPLIATIPAGWLPPDPDAEEVLHIDDPVFLDAHSVKIRLPSGEIQIHQVSVE